MRAIIRPTMPENPCGASKYTNSTYFWANTHFCDFVGACWADCQNDWISTCECICDAYIALIVSKCRNDCSIASQLYPIYVYSTKWKTGAEFLPNTRFSALNSVFSHFLKIAVFFIFGPHSKAVRPLQISSSKALPSTVQECQTPCKYGVLTISPHSLSSSPNPTHPSPKTVYLRPFPSIPVYEIFGGCVQFRWRSGMDRICENLKEQENDLL